MASVTDVYRPNEHARKPVYYNQVAQEQPPWPHAQAGNPAQRTASCVVLFSPGKQPVGLLTQPQEYTQAGNPAALNASRTTSREGRHSWASPQSGSPTNSGSASQNIKLAHHRGSAKQGPVGRLQASTTSLRGGHRPRLSKIPSRNNIALRLPSLTCLLVREGVLMKAVRRLYTEELAYSPR
jgi:hypothetical protein